MKKIILIIVLLVLLLVGGGAAWAYYEFLYTKPLTQTELAELTPDWDKATGGNWSPWFVRADGTTVWNPAASYNAWLATVPEEDKAWPGLIDAYYDHLEDIIQRHEYIEYAGTLPEHAERWSKMREVVATDAFDDLSTRVREATTRLWLGCELLGVMEPYEAAQMREHGIEDRFAQYQTGPGSSSLMDAQLTWLGTLRAFSTILISRAAYELEAGNAEGFMAFVSATPRLGEYAQEFPVLIGELVNLAIQSQARRTIDWALKSHFDPFSEEQLAKLDALLKPQSRFVFNWSGESLMFEDTIRRMCDDTGSVSASKVANNQFSGPACSLPIKDLGAVAQRMLYVHHRCFAQGEPLTRVPWDESAETMQSVLKRERGTLNKLGALILDIAMPAIDPAAQRARAFKQQAIGTRLAISAYRHQLRHGAFPDSIESIDDDLLTIDPIDAFTGDPLKYTLTDTGPLIYSVGDDRVDDGGMIRWESKEVGELGDEKQIRVRTWPEWYTADEAQSKLKANPESIRGDWVLFPMPVSDPEPIDEEDSGD